jgi:hypothetical protein
MSTWTTVLVGALALNAALVPVYRVYRLTKGGPMVDVVGGSILGGLLALLALATAAEWAWARWGALSYALLFGIIVMPLWTLAVLIPLRPRGPDYAFTAVYWISLIVIGIAAIAV